MCDLYYDSKQQKLLLNFIDRIVRLQGLAPY
ncbi:MAG: hypothetical protein JWP44_4606 [Mucilaginibacter sp.]|nr:hypothetical protein [Mucilaginibacter sp.]